jgi:hypothetical protein
VFETRTREFPVNLHVQSRRDALGKLQHAGSVTAVHAASQFCECVKSWAQLRIDISFRLKNEWPEKAQSINDCYHLNQAQIRMFSVLPGPGPSFEPRRDHADL